MPNYTLLVVEEHRHLHAVAPNRETALEALGRELGKQLSIDELGLNVIGGPPYLLDEWHESPHWANPTIPVYARE